MSAIDLRFSMSSTMQNTPLDRTPDIHSIALQHQLQLRFTSKPLVLPPSSFSLSSSLSSPLLKSHQAIERDISRDSMTLLKRQLQQPTRNELINYPTDRNVEYKYSNLQLRSFQEGESYQKYMKHSFTPSSPSSPSPGDRNIDKDNNNTAQSSCREPHSSPEKTDISISPHHSSPRFSSLDTVTSRPEYKLPPRENIICDSNEDPYVTKENSMSLSRKYELSEPNVDSSRFSFLHTSGQIPSSDFSSSFPPRYHSSSSIKSSSPTSSSSLSPSLPPSTIALSHTMPLQSSSLFPVAFPSPNIPMSVSAHYLNTDISHISTTVPLPPAPPQPHPFSLLRHKTESQPHFLSRKRRHSSAPIPVDPNIPFTTYLQNLTKTLQEAARTKSERSFPSLAVSINKSNIASEKPHLEPSSPSTDSQNSQSRRKYNSKTNYNELSEEEEEGEGEEEGEEEEEEEEEERIENKDIKKEIRSPSRDTRDNEDDEVMININDKNDKDKEESDNGENDNVLLGEKVGKIDNKTWFQTRSRLRRDRRFKRHRNVSDLHIHTEERIPFKQGEAPESKLPLSAPIFTVTPPTSYPDPVSSLCQQYYPNHKSLQHPSPHHHHHHNLTMALGALPLHMSHRSPPSLLQSQLSSPGTHYNPSNMYSKMFPGLGNSPSPTSRFADLHGPLGAGSVSVPGMSSISGRISNFFTPSLLGLGSLGMRRASTDKPPPVKKYKCDICQKAFSRSNTLVTHKRIHTGDKPFKCEICGRAFRQPGNLTRHRLTHTTHKPYVCHVCGKAFNRASNLNTHIRTHSSFRQFGCSVCPKTTFQHKPEINGERSYKCDICGRYFAHTSTLLAHRRTHTAV